MAPFGLRQASQSSNIMRLALTALFIALAPSLAMAGTCANLRPQDGPNGYRLRPSPNRCEGLYQSPVAGESVELLSFVRHRIAFDPHTDKMLTITAPPFSAAGAQALSGKPVAVVARALPLHVYYRMDAQVAAGGSLPWPIAEIVLPAGLEPGDLGVVGMVQGPNSECVRPHGRDGLQASLQVAGHGPVSVITFRAPSDLDSFRWSLHAEGAQPDFKQAGLGRTLRAGDPISITLEGPLGSVLTLEIAAKPTGSEYVRRRMQILLP